MEIKKEHNIKEAIKVLFIVSVILFAALFVILVFLPKGIAFGFKECGYPISNENLVVKYAMGIAVRAVGLLLFLAVMKKTRILEWYHCRLDKNSLKLSWLFIVYILLNVEIGSVNNMSFLPVLLMIAEYIMVGLYEETIFRGLVLPIFLKRWGKSRRQVISSVLVASIMFGAAHLVNLFWNENTAAVLTQVCYTAIIGIAFSALLLRTNGNLLWCGLLHGLYDMASGFGDFAEKTNSGVQANAVPADILPYVLKLACFIPLLLYGLFLLRKVTSVTDISRVTTPCSGG